MYKKLIPIIVITIYAFITVIFLRDIIFSSGIIMGGDWGFPLTKIQMTRFAESGIYTWSDRDLLGTQQYFLNSLPFYGLVKLFAILGITGDIYSKLVLVTVFLLSSISMYLFIRFLNYKRTVAFICGFIYITLPFFFNFAAMGWLFVLLSMALLPITLIAFIKSVRDRSIMFAVIAGVLFSLAMIQSQSLIWYPLTFLALLPFLVRSKYDLIAYFISNAIILCVLIILNAYWLSPILFSAGSQSLSTKLGTSGSSLGTWVRLNPLNILRGWGSLFNESYESSIRNSMAYLSFCLPITAYLSLFLLKKEKIVAPFALLSLITITLFTLGPGAISNLPFSDLIRDIARFSVISSFAYVVLIGTLLQNLFSSKKKYIVIGGIMIVIIFIINADPFWRAEMSGESRVGHDVKLRTFSTPKGYIHVENIVNNDPEETRISYLPIAGDLSVVDNKKFNGHYRGIRDIYASFSPKQGHVGLSDKTNGIAASFLINFELISNERKIKQFSKLLSIIGAKYVAIRKNLTHPAYEKQNNGRIIAKNLKSSPNFSVAYEDRDILLLKNRQYLQRIYVPSKIIYTNNHPDKLYEIISNGSYPYDAGLYFKKHNVHSDDEKTILSAQKKIAGQSPVVEYKKINPTKYRVIIHNVNDSFPLISLDAYHHSWRLYLATTEKDNLSNIKLNQKSFYNSKLSDGPINETWNKTPMFDDTHTYVNGFGNSWIINPHYLCNQENHLNDCFIDKKGNYNFELVIEFYPQKYFYKGALLTTIGIALITIFAIILMLKRLMSKILNH